MKLHFLLNRKSPKTFLAKIVLLLICNCNVFGQLQTVTIPATNISSGNNNKPFGTYYGYNRTAMIYTAAEIGLATGTKISRIATFLESFEIANGAAPFVIRMSNTTQSTFNASTFASEIVGQTNVLSGTYILSAATPVLEWATVNLDNPFIYTGNNIKITIETNATGLGNETEAGKQYRWSAGACQTWNADNLPPTGTGSVTSIRPNIRFYYAPVPNNDACFGSIIATTFPFTNVQTLAENATNNSAFLLCANPMNDGVWYEFIGTGCEMSIDVTNVDTTFDAQLDLYTGTCNNLTCIASADDGAAGINESLYSIATTLGTVYYINVGHYNGTTDLPEGNFTIKIAETLPHTVELAFGQNFVKYEGQALEVVVNRSGCTSGTSSINYAANNGSAIRPFDYDFATGTLTWLDGDSTPKTIFINTFTDAIAEPVETFDLILSNPVNCAINGSFPTTITIIDGTAVPPNDACGGATAIEFLPFNKTETLATASTNNAGFLACGGMNDGLWYTFFGTGASITFNVNNVDVDFDPELAVYEGTCGSLGCVVSSDNPFGGVAESVTFASVLNTRYFVNVGYYSDFFDRPEGNYSINIGSTLANNNFDFKSLKVYPNPVTNILNIENGEIITKIEILNMLGQILISKNFNDLKTEIDFSSLQTGNYFAKIYSNDSEQVLKIVKE